MTISQGSPYGRAMINNAELWAGEFGNEYTTRNDIDVSEIAIQKRVKFLEKCLTPIFFGHEYDSDPEYSCEFPHPANILEVGIGTGLNWQHFSFLEPGDKVTGVDVNVPSLKHLDARFSAVGGDAANLPFRDNQFDLVFTMGLLIHIPPHLIERVYSELWRVSKAFVVIAEYFSVQPNRVRYQKQFDLLWTRDYGKELMFNGEQGGFEPKVVGYGCERKGMGGYDDLDYWILSKGQVE